MAVNADPPPGEEQELRLMPESDRSFPEIILHRPPPIHMFQLTYTDLEQLAASGLGRSINVIFAACLFGAFITLLVTVFTSDSVSTIKAASFTAATISVGVLFAFFAWQAFRDYRRASTALKRYTNR